MGGFGPLPIGAVLEWADFSGLDHEATLLVWDVMQVVEHRIDELDEKRRKETAARKDKKP